jgi:hypothetical protein
LSQIIAALALLLAFLWDNAGSTGMESVHQWHRVQRQKYHAGIAADTLILPAAEYRRLTAFDRREIKVGGRMYDIYSVSILEDRVMLAGHYDRFDNALFKIMDSLLGNDSDAAKDHQRSIFVFTGILPPPILWQLPILPATPRKYIVPAGMRPLFAALEVPYAPPRPENSPAVS